MLHEFCVLNKTDAVYLEGTHMVIRFLCRCRLWRRGPRPRLRGAEGRVLHAGAIGSYRWNNGEGATAE